MKRHSIRNLKGPAVVPYVMTIIEDDKNDIGWLMSTQGGEVSPITRHRIRDLILSFKDMNLTVDTVDVPDQTFVNMYYTRFAGSMTELWKTNNLPGEKHAFIGRFAEQEDAVTTATLMNAQWHEALAGQEPLVLEGPPKPQNGPQGAAKRRPRPGKRPTGPRRPVVPTAASDEPEFDLDIERATLSPYDGVPVNLKRNRTQTELVYNVMNGTMPVRVGVSGYPMGLEQVTVNSRSRWPILMPAPGLKSVYLYSDKWDAREHLMRSYTDQTTRTRYTVYFIPNEKLRLMMPVRMTEVQGGNTRDWNISVQWVVDQPKQWTTAPGPPGTSQGVLRSGAAGPGPSVVTSSGGGGAGHIVYPAAGTKGYLSIDFGDGSSSATGTSVAGALADYDEARKAAQELQALMKRQEEERDAKKKRIREIEAREEAREDGKVGPQTFGEIIRSVIKPGRKDDFVIEYPEPSGSGLSMAKLNRLIQQAQDTVDGNAISSQIDALLGVPHGTAKAGEMVACTCRSFEQMSPDCPVHGIVRGK